MSIFSTKLARSLLVALGALILVTGAGYGIYGYVVLRQENTDLLNRLGEAQSQNQSLLSRLGEATTTLANLDTQLGDISSTVGTLKKLADTDPELLKKYSKVYFLNENYIPKGLIDIDSRYVYGSKKLQFLGDAYPFLTRLLDEANAAGLHLAIESSYRSFETQAGLKTAYTVTYGSGANKFSADQGYSEHQLGTTVDFTTSALKGVLTGFDKTPEFAWLQANAYRYGFELSYPRSNGYYIYEPWHWRFVGIALATRLHEERQDFYSLEQRQLDPYLVKLFDQE